MSQRIAEIEASLAADPFTNVSDYNDLLRYFVDEMNAAKRQYKGSLTPGEGARFDAQCDAAWGELTGDDPQPPLPRFSCKDDPESARAANALLDIFIETTFITRNAHLGLVRTKLISAVDRIIRKHDDMMINGCPIDEDGFHGIFRGYEHVIDAVKEKTSVGIFGEGRVQG